jgi:NAD(P)-dependent dehydrogenase (short-subunit alcohol dehydrogenase family)
LKNYKKAQMKLKDKCIIVAGGSSGIGAAAVNHFLKEGARVLSVGLPAEGWQEERTDHKWSITMDLTSDQAVNDLPDICRSHFGSFHGLFHVAGGSGRKFGDGPLHELTDEGWEKTLSLNLSTMMRTNRSAIRALLDQKNGGSIVNLSTALVHHPAPTYFTTHAYAAAKAAVNGLSTATAAYYAEHNIRINVISPGLTDTPMAQRAINNENILSYVRGRQQLSGGRAALPSDMVGMAALLLSDEASFITGQNIHIDGGWSISEGKA